MKNLITAPWNWSLAKREVGHTLLFKNSLHQNLLNLQLWSHHQIHFENNSIWNQISRLIKWTRPLKDVFLNKKTKKINGYWKRSNITRLSANIAAEFVYCKMLWLIFRRSFKWCCVKFQVDILVWNFMMPFIKINKTWQIRTSGK